MVACIFASFLRRFQPTPEINKHNVSNLKHVLSNYLTTENTTTLIIKVRKALRR